MGVIGPPLAAAKLNNLKLSKEKRLTNRKWLLLQLLKRPLFGPSSAPLRFWPFRLIFVPLPYLKINMS